MTADKKLIFVVGCPRSGTSVFSRLLVEHGLVTFHDSRQNSQYTSGYFEYMPLMIFHKGLEKLKRKSDYRITKEPFLKSEYLENDYIAESFQRTFDPIFNRQVDFVKFPQLALSVDFLIEQFPDIQVIGLWRNPAAVFRSLVLKEFPKDMFPASGLRAVLLQSVYGYHLQRAKQKYPGRVTIFCLEDFFNEKDLLKNFLSKQGYQISSAYDLNAVIDHRIWTSKVTLGWRIYFQIMQGAARLYGSLFLGDDQDLGYLPLYNKTIREIGHESFAANA